MSQEIGLPNPLVVPSSGRWIGNDGSWSTFFVQVGTAPQLFHVLPSISAPAIYVPVDKDCEPERMNITDCGAKRGVEVFKSRPSLGFQRNESSTWIDVGVYQMSLGARLGLDGSAYYGYDNVSLGTGSLQDTTQVKDLTVAAYMSPDYWIGQLGLSTGPIVLNETDGSASFLTRLKDEGKIPSLSFGYQAGAPYRFTRIAGSLTLGGYDRSRQSNQTLFIPFSPDLVVGLQSISVESNNNRAGNLLSNGIIVTIDTNTPDLWLPTTVCDDFASSLGLTYFQEADRYIVNDTARSALRTSSTTFSFVIGASATGGATVTIEIPYAAFDLQAMFPIFGTPTYYFPLKRAANESQLTLGRAFLQEAYLSVDLERRNFNISQAVFNSPPIAQELVTIEPINGGSASTSQSGSNSVSLSTGAIVGIAVGAVALIIIIAAAGWWVYSHRRKRKTNSEPSPSLPTDEKIRTESGFDTQHKQYFDPIMDQRLESPRVAEMYAPPGNHMHEPREAHKQLGHFTELVEADSVSPIFEMPAALPELPVSDQHR